MIETFLVIDLKKVSTFIIDEIGVDFEIQEDDGNKGAIVAFDLTMEEYNRIREFISKNALWGSVA